MVSAAFIPAVGLTAPRATRAVSRHTTPVMSMRKRAARLAALPATLTTVAPALAEGTGESLGIDNPLLYIPLILIPAAFFVLFLQFGGGQDNEDFFGTYDERRR